MQVIDKYQGAYSFYYDGGATYDNASLIRFDYVNNVKSVSLDGVKIVQWDSVSSDMTSWTYQTLDKSVNPLLTANFEGTCYISITNYSNTYFDLNPLMDTIIVIAIIGIVIGLTAKIEIDSN